MKILEALRKAINRNTDYCKKITKNYKEESRKIANSFADMKAELKVMNIRLNNAEDYMSGLEDKIMKINRSEQQTERQIKKKEI